MQITITSTTDSKEQVQAAMGDLKQPAKDAPKDQSAPAKVEPQAEQKEPTESDTEGTESESNTDDVETSAEEDNGTETDEGRPKKSKGGFQRRISKITAQKAEVARERDYWRQKALDAEVSGRERKPAEQRPAVDSSTRPDADNFKSHADYVEAVADWKADQKIKALKDEQRNAQLETEHQTERQKHVERVKSFIKTHDDFEDVLETVDDVPISATLHELIVTSENGPALIYELAKNRAELERMNKLNPIKAAVEFGKFQARIAQNSPEEPKKTTSAPTPPSPVGSKGGKTEKSIYDAEKMSQAQYEAARRKQRREATG